MTINYLRRMLPKYLEAKRSVEYLRRRNFKEIEKELRDTLTHLEEFITWIERQSK